MNLSTNAMLIGVVGKDFDGVIQGERITSDAVHLHCLTDFPSDDNKAKGKTVTVYKVDGFKQNYDKALQAIGKQVEIQLQMVPAKNLGAAPKMRCVGFNVPK